jgi:hypothetical protein
MKLLHLGSEETIDAFIEDIDMRRLDVIRDINIGCNWQLCLINKGWMTASDRV